MSQIKQNSINNQLKMQDLATKEVELVEKLKTTMMQLTKSQELLKTVYPIVQPTNVK